MKILKKLAMGVTVSALALFLLVSSALAQSGQSLQVNSDGNALIPIIFEGVTYAPSDAKFKEILNKVKHTVVERDGKAYGYVNAADADKHVSKIIADLSEEVGILESDYVSSFYWNTNYSGARLDVESGRSLATLGIWNDEISSVKTANLRATRLYEHSNFGGVSIFLPPNTNISNLASLNFNDKISSIRVY
ncbi:peptidase inhibitor family I36 protein [Paenibacillus arenosi]|uniref:Peptidase inhibitor family I36 protein n=1 Tax=Paenibacillus arenosi TaxID=2774142 RepID=A0ABR9B1Q7_9BACL|nr:peptidase inhibitor family I36 protein [Paenibacillus arenosi]MBD8500311.1 peptidase inhibitor family I36 protein [Paenibacillus arenosi]